MERTPKRPSREKAESALEANDLVLESLREQLRDEVIDLPLYKERRTAYLAGRLATGPEPPDIVA